MGWNEFEVAFLHSRFEGGRPNAGALLVTLHAPADAVQTPSELFVLQRGVKDLPAGENIAAAEGSVGHALDDAARNEVAQGFRIENMPTCGPWLRTFLEKGRPNRLSQPALETLAVIAYRQPVMRSEIESVRGVNAGHVIKALMEMQLVRIVGRLRRRKVETDGQVRYYSNVIAEEFFLLDKREDDRDEPGQAG